MSTAPSTTSWDPVAAEIVLDSGIPMFLGTWDVTRKVVLSKRDCERMERHPSGLCRFVAECVRSWWPYRKQKPGPVLFDIAPLVWIFRPELYPSSPMALRVETSGRYTRGVTVPCKGRPNADVSVDVQAEQVKDLFLNTLLGGWSSRRRKFPRTSDSLRLYRGNFHASSVQPFTAPAVTPLTMCFCSRMNTMIDGSTVITTAVIVYCQSVLYCPTNV